MENRCIILQRRSLSPFFLSFKIHYLSPPSPSPHPPHRPCVVLALLAFFLPHMMPKPLQIFKIIVSWPSWTFKHVNHVSINLLLLGYVICLNFSLIVHNFYSHCINLQYLALKESNKFWVIWKYTFHFTAVVCFERWFPS